MLKMDFLGLKTLTILKDCVDIIKQSRGIDVDVNTIPLDDELTYQLFSRGDTIGVFQFESPGMQKWLQELQPSRFEDLIAMNALYRPGPMDYIPDFVDRKHGRKKIEYDLDDMEEILHDTYGVTVYQEQVMLLSQRLADFTKGMADKLRKAMGKKQLSVMAELQEKFFEGGSAKGYPKETLDKIWNDWKAFAQYAFNKSHATCYAWVGYQTGYMKAHYRAEYMAAVLSNNFSNIEEITKFSDDCRRNGVKVLGPDINESFTKFTVNKEGHIRFGMSGIKGIGVNAVNSIIDVRENGGPFTDIFNFVERINTSVVNKKGMESLIYSGAFDRFSEVNRGSFALEASKGETFLDLLLRYGSEFQKSSESLKDSLFGETQMIETVRPAIPVLPQLDELDILKKERELVGLYLSSHPLDKFRFEIEHFTTTTLAGWQEFLDNANMESEKTKEVCSKTAIIAGLIKNIEVKPKSNGKGIYCKFTVEDFNSDATFILYDKEYEEHMKYLQPHKYLLIKVQPKARYRQLDEKENGKGSGKDKTLVISSYTQKIVAMALLDNTRDAYIKELVINIPVEIISETFRKEFKKVIGKHKGKAKLTFNIIDSKNRINTEFVSTKHSIMVDDEIISYLENRGLRYRIEKVTL